MCTVHISLQKLLENVLYKNKDLNKGEGVPKNWEFKTEQKQRNFPE
jgi:hypothetical protein